MDKNTSEVIQQLKNKLPDFTDDQQEDLYHKLISLHLLNTRDYFQTIKAKGSREKLERFLGFILKGEDEACEKVVGHLRDLKNTFPVLSELFKEPSVRQGRRLSSFIPPLTPPAPPQPSEPRNLPVPEISPRPHVTADKEPGDTAPQGVNGIFHEILSRLKLEKYQSSKLTISQILTIGPESLESIRLCTVEDTPWHFLRQLMSLNVNARKAYMESNLYTDITNPFCDFEDLDHSGDLHPLDVLCILLHCSDSFLQQEIVTKLSMCQFAVPLLLPMHTNSECIFMLWALRDIVKKWRPHSLEDKNGFMEDNVVNIKMPFFSFVRLEKCSLSKASLMNQLLMPPPQQHNFFIHRDMEGGYIPKKISNGLVEMSWCFPIGQGHSDIFPEPIAVTNLHGDISSCWRQFSLLTQISSAVFIFADCISEEEYALLSQLGDTNTEYFFVFPNLDTNGSTSQYLKDLDTFKVIVKKNMNDATLVQKLQKIMKEFLLKPMKPLTLEGMADIACELGIRVDEDSNECKSAKQRAQAITKRIRNVAEYKRETMKLQGDLCKELAKTKTEICRMKRQGGESSQNYSEKLENKKMDLIKQQYKQTVSAGIVAFRDSISQLNGSERCFFLKWMKFYLDSIARANLSKLQHRYKRKSSQAESDMKQLDILMSESSLGIEHFIRELAQFYDAECYLLKNEEIRKTEQKFQKLPAIAAELLLDGFQLELIDGDTSSIPLEWITEVLSELDKRTGSQCRIRVITVLGVQSTGKSTLLNTMFGLQFPVASGRCTRGAFMTLIKVKENFQKELGCSFVLILDTEGLKAPELSSLDGSYQHDNELATLVVGLSDITIINFAMEHAAEMKDILQIVVHAFLRMVSIGKKPKYYFVHQNVADVSAGAKCFRGIEKLMTELDEMTRTAAKMERRSGVKSFSDVLDPDSEQHSWYVPGLWNGVPPMSSVSTGYSDKVYQFKTHLLYTMKTSLREAQKLSDFSEWIRSLWKAVQYESFIFSFRNSLVADAYEQLHVKYNQLKWNFSKSMFQWMLETENQIRNQTDPQHESSFDPSNNMYEILQQQENNMREALEKYFESGSENVNLIERYREEFLRSVSSLRKNLEDDVKQRLREYVQIQRAKAEIQRQQKRFMEVIERKAAKKYQTLKNCDKMLNHDEEFEKLWNEAFVELNLISLDVKDISQDILQKLRTDMQNSIGAVTMKLNSIHTLNDYKNRCFTAKPEYFDSSWYITASETLSVKYPDSRLVEMNKYVNKLLYKYKMYVVAKMNTKEDYHYSYCDELLNIVNREIQEKVNQKFHISHLFELDLKLHILGRAAPMFQKMHEDFIQENDPRRSLERLKPQYLATFKNIFLETDQCKQRAEDFCHSCLKPAIVDYIYKNLGQEIVDDILVSEHSKEYSSRMFFQFQLLKSLLEEKDFNQYMIYIMDYELFVKSKLEGHIENRYGKPNGLNHLHKKIIHKITHMVSNALQDRNVKASPNVSSLLERFCKLLQKELVIPRNAMNVIIFQNNHKAQRFSECIQSFFPQLVDEILQEMSSLEIQYVLSMVTLKPQDQLFKRVFGCGKLCPFCKVPCEAGGHDHVEHFASVHRPQGLVGYKDLPTNILCNSICSTDVVGNGCFRNSMSNWLPEPYKNYRKFYPDWVIQSDAGIHASDYWKFVLREFNYQLADEYDAKPAEIPINWKKITKEQAMRSLRESFNL